MFAEPWQAQAFALAVKLSQQGYFSWKKWSAALADELETAASSEYYEHWLGLRHIGTHHTESPWSWRQQIQQIS